MTHPTGHLAGTFIRRGAAAGVFALALHGVALAQTPVGGAVVVRNDVKGQTGGKVVQLAKDDTVFRDQLLRTAIESMAKIVFLDTTNMTLGPESIAKLDRFVYNGDGTAKAVAINATKGAFRFFSGKSPHDAYKVTTPQAVIGVRGTTYDVLVEGGRTLIVLQEGAVRACVRNNPTRCRLVDQPGQSVIVDDTDITGPLPASSKPWDFGNLCGSGAAARDLCNKTTRFALNVPAANPPAIKKQIRPKQRAAKPAAKPKRRVVRPRPSSPPRVRIARPGPIYDDGPIYDAPPAYVPPPRVVIYPGYVPPPRWVPPGRPGGGWRPPRPPRPPGGCDSGYRSRGCGGGRPPGHGGIDRPRPPRHGGVYKPGRIRPNFGGRPREGGFGRGGFNRGSFGGGRMRMGGFGGSRLR